MSGDMQQTALNGTADFIAALDTLCGLAQYNLYIFEKDFENLGYNSEARYSILRDFLLSSPYNHLHLLAHNTRPLTQNCPRLLNLLRQFTHNMHIYQTSKILHHLSAPFAVADKTHYVRRFHFDDPRGILGLNDTEGARALTARFDEMWASSQPAVSTTTLGL